MSGGTIDLVFVWRQNERVSSGRRAESLAMWFSRHPEVRRVIYLEPPLSRKSFDVDRRWRKLLPLHVRRVDDSFWRLTVLKPNTLLSLDSEAAERRTAWLSVRLVQRFLKRNTSRRRWLWIYPPNPFSTALVRALPHDRLICDIVDDVVSTKDTDREHCEVLVQESSATFTTSADLADRLRPWHAGAMYVPNGLEPSFIADVNQPTASSTEPPRHRLSRRRFRTYGPRAPRRRCRSLSTLRPPARRLDRRVVGRNQGAARETERAVHRAHSVRRGGANHR